MVSLFMSRASTVLSLTVPWGSRLFPASAFLLFLRKVSLFPVVSLFPLLRPAGRLGSARSIPLARPPRLPLPVLVRASGRSFRQLPFPLPSGAVRGAMRAASSSMALLIRPGAMLANAPSVEFAKSRPRPISLVTPVCLLLLSLGPLSIARSPERRGRLLRSPCFLRMALVIVLPSKRWAPLSFLSLPSFPLHLPFPPVRSSRSPFLSLLDPGSAASRPPRRFVLGS